MIVMLTQQLPLIQVTTIIPNHHQQPLTTIRAAM